MISESTFNLIQRAIDNEASPEELKHLEDLSARDEEVRCLYAGMQTMVGQLEKTEPVEPPPHLDQKIKAACRARSVAAEKVSLLERIYQFTGSLFTTRMGVSYAAGLATGLVLFVATSFFIKMPGDVDPVDMTGSIMLNHDEDALPAATRTVELSSARVDFTSQMEEKKIILTVDVSADQDVAIDLEYPVDELTLKEVSGFEALRSNLSLSPGEIGIIGARDCRITLLFEPTHDEGGPLSYNVQCDNQLRSGSIGLAPDSR